MKTGLINVNKPEGLYSSKIVNKIKRFLGAPCGHMGTLDPLASGVLPVAIGNSARLFDYFLDKKKEYIAEFKFGLSTDTLDITGKIDEENSKIPTKEQILSVLPNMVGDIYQLPPKYSAKCVNGKRGYQLAREGKEFELSKKLVKIDAVELLEQTALDTFKFKIGCGGGTYIRSIARDIALNLDTVAVMSSLIRTQSGVFKIENSVNFDDLTQENINKYIIPTEDVLDFPKFIPEGVTYKKLFNGIKVETEMKDGLYKIYDKTEFYGIAEVKDKILYIKTKLC